MQTASSFSLAAKPRQAAVEAGSTLLQRLGRTPDLLVLYATQHKAHVDVAAALNELMPGVQLIGGTSCAGVMTEEGFHTGPDGALGLFGLVDADGAYGVGSCPLGDDSQAAGARAIELALAAAGRDFETPHLVWCCQPPGAEEAIIAGVQSVIGPNTPIIGGSAADEAINGAWRQFSPDGLLDDHVVVAALFPSGAFGRAFQSGYAPTEHEGTVTRADGRTICEIDGKPAAEVYSAWTSGLIDPAVPGMILAASTPCPLGRIAGESHGVPSFVLSHPAGVEPGGGISLFTDVSAGDRVILMRGSSDSLVKRAGLVARDALGGSANGCSGGLIIYCGGCMLHVRDRMTEVVGEVIQALPGAPFLGAFTFGEQGEIVDSCNRHGNLMVSALTFA